MPPVRGGATRRCRAPLDTRRCAARRMRMNYRHAFHAGSFADVVKHAVLGAHPGASRRQAGGLSGDRHPCGRRPLRSRRRGGEPQRRMARRHRAPARRDDRGAGARAAQALSRRGRGAQRCRRGSPTYPGSPALARALLRPQDRLIACELEPKAAAALARNLARDRRVKTIAIDGWIALNAYVPPPERRGVVLIDPPFEERERLHPAGAWARSRAPQMGERHLSALVPDQGPAGAGCAGAAAAALRHRQDLARRARGRARARARPARRLRPDRGQSAVDARRRACSHAAGTRRDRWAAAAAAIASIGSAAEK